MTIAYLTLALMVAATFGLGAFFRRARRYVEASEGVWNDLIGNVNRFVNDLDVPDLLARDVVAFAEITGCGCFTRAFLLDIVTRKLAARAAKDSEAELAISQLNEKQRTLLTAILRDVIRFDALHSPLSGWAARRIMEAIISVQVAAERSADADALGLTMKSAHYVAKHSHRRFWPIHSRMKVAGKRLDRKAVPRWLADTFS